ncbi:cyclic di-GMP phosphodiesterase response regulator RpfG [Oxobacter pfennigii]|uniref:Cyclic di-GMP phosphodiesterase response regulator RpfG n=1 Tax=Oxobacter pfennigii TaxID=36849 RepID=A0A0P9AK99_9CLOT|nr:HD-GYP domain-containing protein [Oxobacter pfennigii]KPU45783.1 cyclic di-GMP phosphodiesterase response regulator RpfG [Oxobacter pfennigii]
MKDKKLAVFLIFIYVLAASCYYFAFTSHKFFYTGRQPSITEIILFILLSVLTESGMISLKHLGVSPGFAITSAAFLLFGPFWTMIIVSIGTALRVQKRDGVLVHILNTPVYKTLFNFSEMAISAFCGWLMYDTINTGLFSIQAMSVIKYAAFVIAFLVVNTAIISTLIFIISRNSFIEVYVSNIKFGILNIIAMAPLGAVLKYLYEQYNFVGAFVIMVLVMLMRYIYVLYIEAKSKYMQTVQVLMHAVEARDKYTEGHARRVADIVEMIAKEMKYSESRIEQLIIASYIHDVGKIGIDDSILNKPGKLTPDEYDIIKSHPEIGYKIVKDIKDIGDIPMLVRHHHERYDGKGYPSGKNGSELPIDVFIIQLADSIDAMESDRPYRKGMNLEEIIAEIVNNKGTQFHPDVVDIYFKILKKKNNIA